MSRAKGDLGEAEVRVGRTLKGKWTLDRLIGTGGSAAVYEASHRNRNRVAVKVLHARHCHCTSHVARFRREGYAANRVGHSGVARVHDDDLDEQGSPFLVMDLLQGRTVAALAIARGGVLPVPEILDIAEKLLAVLAAAHDHGILHRDVKPQNVFLTNSGELKVLDFGIARLNDPPVDGGVETEIGTLLGTPSFASPEQVRGRVDEMDARSDVWSVGATLFTLATGRFVHEGRTLNEQLGLAMMATAPSLGVVAPTLPRGFVQLVDRALSYAPEHRWPEARTMQEAVRWLADRSTMLNDPEFGLPPRWAADSSVARGGVAVDTLAEGRHEPQPRRGSSRLPWAILLAVCAGAFGHAAVDGGGERQTAALQNDSTPITSHAVVQADPRAAALRPDTGDAIPFPAANVVAEAARAPAPRARAAPSPAPVRVARGRVSAKSAPSETSERRKALAPASAESYFLDRRY